MKMRYKQIDELRSVLSRSERRVLGYIITANDTEFICTKGAVMRMAEYLNYSQQTISNAVNCLCKKGFLVRKEYGSRNEYGYSQKLFN